MPLPQYKIFRVHLHWMCAEPSSIHTCHPPAIPGRRINSHLFVRVTNTILNSINQNHTVPIFLRCIKNIPERIFLPALLQVRQHVHSESWHQERDQIHAINLPTIQSNNESDDRLVQLVMKPLFVYMSPSIVPFSKLFANYVACEIYVFFNYFQCW